LLTRLRSLPDVQSAALTTWLPLTRTTWFRTLTIEGHPPWERGQEPRVEASAISPGYFRTLGVQMSAGRAFTDDDRADMPGVVIINETLARRFFPGENPLGKRLDGPNRQSPWATIVGVVADVKHLGLDQEVRPETYFPYLQAPPGGSLRLLIRTAAGPLTLATALRRAVTASDPDQPVYDLQLMEQRLANSMALRRNGMLLFGIFAAVALLIAAIGIYGVISYAVGQRTHEIGIRMALGAQAGDVLKLIMRQGLVVTLTGIAIGLAGASVLTSVMKSLLFEVSATDPATFLSISLLLAAVALLACYLPARKATKVDPLVALRHE
ncbi:MAG: ABC transporter permease, partial [Acidobacteriales bacterium]|nr:ABC transporter permease [Terriglobales bacterium]